MPNSQKYKVPLNQSELLCIAYCLDNRTSILWDEIRANDYSLANTAKLDDLADTLKALATIYIQLAKVEFEEG